MAEHSTTFPAQPDPSVADLERGFDAVGALIERVRPDQWSAPTPCTDWDVRRLVEHLVGMNRVFTALLNDEPPPKRDTGHVEEDLPAAYRASSAALAEAFARPGALEHQYVGPLGSATGEERLRIRLYDLLAHGWDLALATGQPATLPEDLAEQSLAFVRTQLLDGARGNRFAAPQDVAPDANAIERLVAFLGRPVQQRRDLPDGV